MTKLFRQIIPAAALLYLAAPALAQNNAEPAPEAEATVSPSPTPKPLAIPIADVVAQAEIAEASFQNPASAPDAEETPSQETTELPALTAEINDRLAQTNELVRPSTALETLRDLEVRWQKTAATLTDWTRTLTAQAAIIDDRLALLPDQQAAWTATRKAAQTGDTPPEIRERIDGVLAAITKTESELQAQRAKILSEQSRVAEQSKRVADALQLIRTAQTEAVSSLFVRDSPPIWNARIFQPDSEPEFTEDKSALFASQVDQLREFVAPRASHFIYLALIFCGIVGILIWVQRGAAKWTEQDPALRRANRVLQAPFATAAVISLFACGPLFDGAPRLFWAILAIAALVPIVSILRRLVNRVFQPVLYALVVFSVIAQLRKVLVAMPGLSRLLLIVEVVGGMIFLVWLIRSTLLSSSGPTSHRIVRGAARFGIVLMAVILGATVLGYFRFANYLAAGTLSAAYTAVLFYAAAVILAGLTFFALRVRPFSEFRLVSLHRPLLHRRITRILFVIAAVAWALLALEEFSLRVPVIERITRILSAELSYQSLHLSLGAVLAFALTLWIAAMVSRFIRFALEEDIYRRFRFAAGSSYAASTLLHYVILMIGFFLAIAALGVDMSKFAVLAGALGVGIGFGLQNIISNFVSGIILLFERPVNVGDVVQVGEATGMIQRIGIRASVIRVANSSELIVPNSLLISEQVTNWTLSNRQRRIELPVGVAYGSKPPQVIELLTRVAAAHPSVAKNPAPQVLMTEFGADSLNFEVRMWTDEYDQWLQIKSDVAVAITDALADASIGIPFPQRDLHLQTIAPEVEAAFRSRVTPPTA